MPKSRQTVMTGGNVDVEALFGAQATKKSKSKGTRRIPRRDSSGSNFGHNNSFKMNEEDLARAAVIAERELERMEAAEFEQCRTDGFWGLDKEYSDRCIELEKMRTEDSSSAENERLWSISTIQRQWEEEERKKAEDARLSAAVEEEHARLGYMDAFYSTSNSGFVLQYPWPTKPASNVHPSTDMDTCKAKFKCGYDILYCDFGNMSTIHVNGLQRAHEICADGETVPMDKQGSQSKAIASVAMRPPGTRHLNTTLASAKQSKASKTSRPPTNQTVEESASGFPATNAQMSRTKVNLLESGRRYVKGSHLVLAGAGQKYNDLYDGHPIYRWDQEQMLRVVFGMLDDSNQGRIGRAQISEMARSTDIQGILKYTVYWLPLKRRQWTFFYNIFEDEAECISVEEWLQAAHGLAMAEEVSVAHVRLDRDHRAIADACSVTGDWSEQRFASEARGQMYKHDRAAATLRLVSPNDLVWALYSNGSRWLPARVLAIHNTDGHSLCNSTVTVRYIMSTEEFKKCQRETETREYLPKKKKNTSNANMLDVKPLHSEVEVCSYVFDIVDKDCKGAVEPEAITSTLTSLEMTNIVNSSSTLSLIVHGGAKLLEFIPQLFPPGVEDGRGVSKSEFVEFCSLVQSMNLYDDFFVVEQKDEHPPVMEQRTEKKQHHIPKSHRQPNIESHRTRTPTSVKSNSQRQDEEEFHDPFVTSQY